MPKEKKEGRNKLPSGSVGRADTSTLTSSKETFQNPLYGVAMLKVAMELKKENPPSLEEVLSGVLRKMGLDEPTFRQYLAQNGGLLRAISQKG